MAFLVSLTGIAVAAIGLLGVAAPERLVDLLARRPSLTGLPATFTVRLGLGVLFLTAAPSCRLPAFVRLIGVVELVGAAALLALGATRLRRFVDWWLACPPSFIRSWCSAALVFGIVLAYAGG